MQAKPRIWKVLVTALIVSLLLGSCGGGTTGKTWFNLPSIALKIQPNGSATAYGIPIPAALLQPAQIAMLQGANVQRLEVRWGYNGLHAYLNGEDMPYLAWDEASASTLQELVLKVPGLPNANLIARALPWLRTVGWGVKLDLPLASGATALDLPRWNGETAVTPAAAGEPTLGPLEISNLNFDPQGNGYIGAMPLSDLGAPVALPPATLDLLKSLGITRVGLDTEPDGLHITLNDQPFPTLAYDAAYLERAMGLANVLAPDAGLTTTLNDVASQLPGADVKLAVSFDGQPVGEANLSNLEVTVNPDGSVNALGINLPGGSLIPPSALSMLQDANIQQLDVATGDNSVALTVNGQALPGISWSDDGLTKISGLVGSLTGMDAGLIPNALAIANNAGAGVSLKLPPGEGQETVDVPAEAPAIAPVDLGAFAPPVIKADLLVDANGNISTIGNLNTADLAAFGLPASIALPGNILDMLKGLGADKVGIVSEAGKADVQLDGETALSLTYDSNSLRSLLALLKPMLGVALLDDPTLSKLIDEQIMPIAPGAQLNVTVDLP